MGARRLGNNKQMNEQKYQEIFIWQKGQENAAKRKNSLKLSSCQVCRVCGSGTASMEYLNYEINLCEGKEGR